MSGKANATRCPSCGKPAHARWRPFCSRRCAELDLHRWLGGRYRIATEEHADGHREDDPADPD